MCLPHLELAFLFICSSIVVVVGVGWAQRRRSRSWRLRGLRIRVFRCRLLEWDVVSGATEYRVQLRDQWDHCSLVVDSIVPASQTTLTTPSLDTGRGFCWRVRARDAGGWGTWTSWGTSNFVSGSLDPPVLTSPTSGDAFSGTVSWQPVAGALLYRIFVHDGVAWLAPQHRPDRRRVHSHQSQRQRDELVHAFRHLCELEAFQDGDAVS